MITIKMCAPGDFVVVRDHRCSRISGIIKCVRADGRTLIQISDDPNHTVSASPDWPLEEWKSKR